MFDQKKLRLIDSTEFIRHQKRIANDADSTAAKNSHFSSDTKIFQSTQKKFSSFGQEYSEQVFERNTSKGVSWKSIQDLLPSFDLLQEFIPLSDRFEYLLPVNPSHIDDLIGQRREEQEARLTNQEDGVLIEDLASKPNEDAKVFGNCEGVLRGIQNDPSAQAIPKMRTLGQYAVFDPKSDVERGQEPLLIPYPQRSSYVNHSRSSSRPRAKSPAVSQLKRKVLDILEKENSICSKRSKHNQSERSSFKVFLQKQNSLSEDIYYQILEEKHLKKSNLDQADSILNTSQSARRMRQKQSVGSDSEHSQSMISKLGSPMIGQNRPHAQVVMESSYNFRSRECGTGTDTVHYSWLGIGKPLTQEVSTSSQGFVNPLIRQPPAGNLSRFLEDHSGFKSELLQPDLSYKNPFKVDSKDVIYPTVLKAPVTSQVRNMFSIEDNLYFSASSAVDEIGSQASILHVDANNDSGILRGDKNPKFRPHASLHTASNVGNSRGAGLASQKEPVILCSPKPSHTLGWPKKVLNPPNGEGLRANQASTHSNHMQRVSGVITLPSPILSAKSIRFSSPPTSSVTFRTANPIIPATKSPIRLPQSLPQPNHRH